LIDLTEDIISSLLNFLIGPVRELPGLAGVVGTSINGLESFCFKQSRESCALFLDLVQSLNLGPIWQASDSLSHRAPGSARRPFLKFAPEPTGKRVLVTGGSRGIGAAIVRRFQLSGAFVATTARSVSPEDQGSTLFVNADIGTVSGMQEVINRVEGEWGGIDVLINNVGGTETKPGGFEVLTDKDWQNILNVNLLAAVRLDRAFLPGMIERKSGVVMHISSISRRLPFSNSTLAYAAAKGALSTYSKGLAKGVAGNGVRVVMISLGFIELREHIE
jgi:NADP-dependent 3-hydroxy acid dehydrogenase YdfG